MKKLITSMDISEARKAGRTGITVPPGALITPQARDDAKNYGIALLDGPQEDACAPQAVAGNNDAPSSTASLFTAARQIQQPVREISLPKASGGIGDSLQSVARRMARQTSIVSDPANSGQAASPPGSASLAEQVQQRVTALLSGNPVAGSSALPNLEETIAAVIAESMGAPTGNQSNPTSQQASGTEFTAAAGAPSMASGSGVNFIKGPIQASASAVPGEVHIEESLLPGTDGPGVTRMHWKDSSFEWTVEFDEVLVVTGGELEAGGITLKPGEALRAKKGSKLTLSAHGSTSCVCSSWPVA